MRAPPAFRLLALALGREVSTVDWPEVGIEPEGPPRGSPVVDGGACTACGDCVSSCPSACLLTSVEGGIPTVDAGRCVRCGICVAICGEDAIAMNGPRDIAVYARADLLMDDGPMEVKEVVRSPSRIYRLSADLAKQGRIEPDAILRCRKENLERQ